MNTVKSRLVALVLIGVTALALVAGVAIHGLRGSAATLAEVAEAYLPSVLSLSMVNEGQTAIRSENRLSGLRFLQPDELKTILARKAKIWERIDKGWKIYLPLPREAEEEALWKALERDWAVWREGENKLSEVIANASRAPDEDAAKALKASYDAILKANVPLFEKAEESLNKLIEMNARVAGEMQKSSRADSQRTMTIMIVVALLALVVLLVAGYRIANAILATLGGEPDDARRLVEQIAAGDLSQSIRVRDGDRSSLIAYQGQMQERLRTMLREIAAAAGKTDTAAQALSGAAQQVASASASSSDAAAAMAAAVEEMTVSIGQISDNARDALAVASQAGAYSAEGGKVIEQAMGEIEDIARTVRATSTSMSGLQQSSAQISSVVQVIREVAEQTNLLALNAAIEAARAGESGRGFAVVADEVRKLAERTALATSEINNMVLRIQEETKQSMAAMDSAVDKVGSGVQLATAASEAMRNIRGSVGQLVTVVQDIGQAIQEQSSASQSIAERVEQVAQTSEENHSAAGEAATSAGTLGQLAAGLRLSVGQFRI